MYMYKFNCNLFRKIQFYKHDSIETTVLGMVYIVYKNILEFSLLNKKSLKIPKGQSEAINQRERKTNSQYNGHKKKDT